MAVTTELGVERKLEKREIFLTLKALESDPGEEDIDFALVATKIIRAIKRGCKLSKRNDKIKGCHKDGSCKAFIRKYQMQRMIKILKNKKEMMHLVV